MDSRTQDDGHRLRRVLHDRLAHGRAVRRGRLLAVDGRLPVRRGGNGCHHVAGYRVAVVGLNYELDRRHYLLRVGIRSGVFWPAPKNRKAIMDLNTRTKAYIDSLSRNALLSHWRFSPPSDPWLCGDTGEYWKHRLENPALRPPPTEEELPVAVNINQTPH